jgi:hypothetical protein
MDLSKNTLLPIYNIEMITDILQYKVVPDLIEFNCIIEEFHWRSDVFDLLVKYGLQITINELKTAFINNICIGELERFGIEYDENLYYLCHIHNFFPADYIKNFKIDKNVLALRLLCRTQVSISKIMSFTKKNNVKLDRYCMEHVACYNPKMLFHMIEVLKLKPTMALFYWSNYNKKDNDKQKAQQFYYMKFIEQYDINSNYLKQPFIY